MTDREREDPMPLMLRTYERDLRQSLAAIPVPPPPQPPIPDPAPNPNPVPDPDPVVPRPNPDNVPADPGQPQPGEVPPLPTAA